MQQAILMVLALGVAANLVIAFLAFRDGAYSQVAIAVALAALEAEMKGGRIATLKQAQAFLIDRFEIGYSIGGLSALFRRKRIKLKTGRPRHAQASAEEQEAWKKTVR